MVVYLSLQEISGARDADPSDASQGSSPTGSRHLSPPYMQRASHPDKQFI